MRIILFLFSLYFISFNAMGQVESTKKSGELKLKDYNVPTFDDVPKIDEQKVTIGYKSIYSKKEDDYLKKFIVKKEEKVESILVQKDKGYDFDEDRKNALNNKLKEATTGNKSTQYLGEYTVETNLIRIMCRDHQAPDGDVVSILLNDKVNVQGILLESEFKTFYVSLEKGSNHIDFLALNQGSSGPNTAAFIIIDEFGKQITASEWNLNTGVKASLIIMNKTEDSKEEE